MSHAPYTVTKPPQLCAEPRGTHTTFLPAYTALRASWISQGKVEVKRGEGRQWKEREKRRRSFP
jgi:hypothetical protein